MYDDFRHVIRDHVYDKCWLLDITWAEVEALLDDGEVVEQHALGEGDLKEIRLLLQWVRPLHVVYIVNERRRLVVYRTLYEPDTERWHPGYRERRR